MGVLAAGDEQRLIGDARFDRALDDTFAIDDDAAIRREEVDGPVAVARACHARAVMEVEAVGQINRYPVVEAVERPVDMDDKSAGVVERVGAVEVQFRARSDDDRAGGGARAERAIRGAGLDIQCATLRDGRRTVELDVPAHL